MKVETYLINLDGSHDRLESATRQLKQQSFPFIRFPAYDGRGKSLSDFENYNDKRANQIMGRSLISSELGCYLSHVGCVQKFLETDADYLIVLEDDLEIADDFSILVKDILNYLYNRKDLDWYLINIGAKKRKLYKHITSFNGCDLIKACYFPIRTIGLIWSRTGADAFLREGREIYAPIDNYLQSWLSKNGKGLSVWRPLVHPAGFVSDIDGIPNAGVNNMVRNSKDSRDISYSFRRQKRMWRDRMYALKHLVIDK